MSIEAKAAARAIRDHSLKVHRVLTPKLRKANVVSVNPLQVSLVDADLLLEDEMLLFGAWPRYYDHVFGIKPGDTVFVYPMSGNEEWVLLDVVVQADMLEGFATKADALSLHTDHGEVVATVPYFDANGDTVGVALIYDPGTLVASPD